MFAEWLNAVQHADLARLHVLLPDVEQEVLTIKQEKRSKNSNEAARYCLVAAVHAIFEVTSSEAEHGAVPAVDAFLAQKLVALLGQLGGQLSSKDKQSLALCLLLGDSDPGFEGDQLVHSAINLVDDDAFEPNQQIFEQLLSALLRRRPALSETNAINRRVIAFIDASDVKDALPLRCLLSRSLLRFGWASRYSKVLEPLCDASSFEQVPSEILAKAMSHLSSKQLQDETGATTLASELLSRNAQDLHSVNALIRYHAETRSASQALTFFRGTESHARGKVNDETFLALLLADKLKLESLETIEDATELVTDVERLTSTQTPPVAWENCVCALLGNEKTYMADNAAGLQHSPARRMEAELLLDRCKAEGREVTTEARAMIVRRYHETYLADYDAALSAFRALSAHAKGQVSRNGAYNSALRMLDILVRAARFSDALTLLVDLDKRGEIILLEDIFPLCEKLMRRAMTEADAVALCKVLFAFLQRIRLDAPGDWVVRYLSLAMNTRLPHPDHWEGVGLSQENLFDIFRALSRTGNLPDAQGYRQVLTAITKDIRQAKKPMKRAILSHILAIHQVLKADVKLEPDLQLLNTLMNAYNLVGEVPAALDIWHALRAGQAAIDGATMSIVFDLCGWANLLREARHALSWAKSMERRLGARGEPVMNSHAWLSYHECLCRCGELQESIDLAFDRVESDQGLPLEKKPRRSEEDRLFSLLLKFAARERDSGIPDAHDRWTWLRGRLRRERPKVWNLVQAVGTDRRRPQFHM